MFNFFFARPKKKMPKQRVTPHRGSIGQGGGCHKENIGDTDGFVAQVSLPVRCMIDEWESKVVSDHLASRRSDGRINHYRIIKNMLGLLMEDMTIKWNGAGPMHAHWYQPN